MCVKFPSSQTRAKIVGFTGEGREEQKCTLFDVHKNIPTNCNYRKWIFVEVKYLFHKRLLIMWIQEILPMGVEVNMEKTQDLLCSQKHCW